MGWCSGSNFGTREGMFQICPHFYFYKVRKYVKTGWIFWTSREFITNPSSRKKMEVLLAASREDQRPAELKVSPTEFSKISGFWKPICHCLACIFSNLENDSFWEKCSSESGRDGGQIQGSIWLSSDTSFSGVDFLQGKIPFFWTCLYSPTTLGEESHSLAPSPPQHIKI